MSQRHDADVVVLGAGLAGLAAARRIVEHGYAVLVLEARERVGGRVLDYRLPNGDAIELGGLYCTPAHFGTVANHAIVELAADVGVAAFPGHDEGARLLRRSDSTIRYDGRHRSALPLRQLPGLLELLLARRRLDRLARRVDAAAPWELSHARRVDAQTLGAWADRTMLTRTGRGLLRMLCEPVFAADPAEVSRLHVAAYLASNGTLGAMVATRGGAQSHRLAGGPQLVAERVADSLGDAVLTGRPAIAVRWSASGVEVASRALRVRARRAIVAMTPALATHIDWQPSLPTRDQLAQRMLHGQAHKLVALYAEPFWRADGLSGQAATDGPIRVVLDSSPPRGRPGALAAYAVGRDALALRELAGPERRRLVLRVLVALFGPRASSPEAIVEHDWIGDPWARGAHGGVAVPGTWSSLGRALRAPVGPLHWAGSETAVVGMGSMSGAVLSGRRAAEEALAALEQAAH